MNPEPATRSTLPRAVASRFAEALREKPGARVTDVRLFGSCARGDAIDLTTDTGLEHGLRLSPTLFDRATYDRWFAQERTLVVDIEREGYAL